MSEIVSESESASEKHQSAFSTLDQYRHALSDRHDFDLEAPEFQVGQERDNRQAKAEPDRFERRLQPREFSALGTFGEFYAGQFGLNCRHVDVVRNGDRVRIQMQRQADAMPYQVIASELEIGRQLNYDISVTDGVVVLDHITGLTHPSPGNRANLPVHRLELRPHREGGTSVIITQMVDGRPMTQTRTWGNTIAYDGFRDLLQCARRLRPVR